MHLIVLENEVSSFRGGQERSLLDVCRGLYHRGHSISLLYIKEGDLLSQYNEFCSNLIQVSSYRIERRKIIQSINNFLLNNIKLKTTTDSVVYSNQYHDSFFAYTLALSKNIPFVCHLRLPPPPLRTLGFQWGIGMQGAKRLIAVSNQTKLDWINRGFKEDKIDVVYNGVNPEIFIQNSDNISTYKNKLGINENTRIISYIGRLDKEKGLETLIQGFALFLKSDTNAKLLIAGKPLCQDNDYKKHLIKLTNDLGIEENVSFLGHVNNTISLYQISDCTILPSLHSEPFGRTIIESMACGTPVVASRTGGITEILTLEFQDGLFEPGNVQDLVTTLNIMLKKKDLDPHLSDKCRKHILCNFHLDRMVDGVEKVLVKSLKN
ncbi:glycosyltransferase family 4 protein [Iningainema tapete]|uniref:Glycosyltransferase family 4 protein n=1 Tax=Iningainema tapete BLCC-T55 TaxID=2748662 RepID=A0A8J7BWS3_9CYAN|nr:glycosyltransferase family 4 protein [Iningainema tapete]MBD2771468.1 glycosyltransferase family 4 protein [Iningainema tapete BLCC-T55]